jgi:hypothetical protein
MTTKIMMIDTQTGRKVVSFPNVMDYDVNRIVCEMNRLNEEAARLTGRAVRYVYHAVFFKESK